MRRVSGLVAGDGAVSCASSSAASLGQSREVARAACGRTGGRDRDTGRFPLHSQPPLDRIPQPRRCPVIRLAPRCPLGMASGSFAQRDGQARCFEACFSPRSSPRVLARTLYNAARGRLIPDSPTVPFCRGPDGVLHAGRITGRAPSQSAESSPVGGRSALRSRSPRTVFAVHCGASRRVGTPSALSTLAMACLLIPETFIAFTLSAS